MEKQSPANNRCALIISAVALAAFCILIFAMSAQAGDESGEMSLGFADRFASIFVPGYNEMSASDQLIWQKRLNLPVRKTAHAMEYALLGMLAFNFANRMRKVGLIGRYATSLSPSGSGLLAPSSARRTAVVSWVFSALYAASDEIHQYFVPGREFHFYDIAIDAAGAVIGILIIFALCTLLARRRTRQSEGVQPRRGA